MENLPPYISNEVASPSAKHLRIIFENAEEAFVLLDRDGIIQAFNSKATSNILSSLPHTTVQAGQSIFDFVDEDRKAHFRHTYRQVLEGELFRFEKDYIGADGKPCWFQFSLKPVSDGDEVTGVCITGTNISDRKRAQLELASSQRKFRGLVENSGDAITIFSAEGKASYISPALTRLLGYTDQNTFEITLFDIVHPEDLPFVIKAWQKVLASPGKTFFNNQCRIRHSNGNWRWINGTLTNHLNDPDIAGIVDNLHDVTDLVNAQAEQRLVVDRYKYLFNHNPEPMWIYHPVTLKFLEVNDAAVDQYGYTRKEFLGMTLLDIRERDEAGVLMEAVKGRQGKTLHRGGIWKHQTRAKGPIYVEISSHDIVHNGEAGILVIAHDVTERTKTLELLYTANEEKTRSEQAVHELNQTLNLRAEQLARSNEELERFAYVASHDLQEPLRMVSSFLQLLQKNYKETLDERANKYIDFAVDGATRMRKLILDLLTYSQVSNKKEQPVAVDPNKLMEGIIVDYHPRIMKRNVALHIEELPVVMGNEMQINQLFRNLISNAIKYNNSERPEIHIGSVDQGQRIEFFVKDNGIGIEEKFREKVFIIFQRLHQKGEYTGTGIGLAICKKIVELHGGKIRIESTPGEGTTFFFTLVKQGS